jgi:endonuclease/exonuclease/phosphatase family metal-dependent hydrolase
MVFIGDMNADPSSRRTAGGRAMATLEEEGWQIPRAGGEWSYCGARARTRIDHAIVAPSVTVEGASYCVRIGDLVFAGLDADLYDHAPLLLEIRSPTI